MTDLAPEEHAELAGLRYVCDDGPGIHRRRRGKGFSYVLPDGSVLTDPAERKRIEAIAIPPAWTDVWICRNRNGHILATGRDAKGRKQYRYHPEWERVRSEDKYGSLPSFAEALPTVRQQVDADLRRRGLPREKVLALVVRLLDRTLIRIGNEAYAAQNESYGLTTLRPDHVEVGDDGSLAFDFVAKGGLDQHVYLEDKQLARIVQECSELGGQDLFTYRSEGQVLSVSSSDVNDYLRDLVGNGTTAKHFRTWGGTVTAAQFLAEAGRPESDKDADRTIIASCDEAADALGNTRTVCRQSYIHPTIPEAYKSGELAELWPRSRPTRHLDRAERLVQRLLDR